MSLLMKALEKAAKDREETDVERTPATAASPSAPSVDSATASELTLEPRTPPAASAPRESPAQRAPGLAPRKPGRRSEDIASPAARDSTQAATVIRAGRHEAGGAGAYVREHPLIVFGTLASLFLIAYGTYVYLQMTNPGIFISRPRPTQSAPIVPPPPAPPAPSGGNPAAQQPLATTLLLPPQSAPALPIAPSGTTGPVGATTTAGTPAPVGTTTTAGTTARASTTAPVGTTTTAGATAISAAPTTVAPASPPPRDTIKVTRGSAAPTLSPLLVEAYQALANGNLDSSQRLYSQVLKGDPNNIDALLGSAAIAAQSGDSDGAARNYLKVLQFDPRNTLAQAGLIGILGAADPLAAETRVKQLIERDPSAYLYFTLGNVYVDQSRWPDAQQAYFQAHHLQPDNPDYAYNLAVGLEHIGQPKLALHFYRRATQLAAAKGRANFSTGAAVERIGKLERFVE